MNLQRVLLETADVGPDDVVLEIGAGTGGLTVLLARRAAAVVTVEVDPRLFQLAGEELFDFDNVTLLQSRRPEEQESAQPGRAGGGRRSIGGAGPPLQTGGQSALQHGHAR